MRDSENRALDFFGGCCSCFFGVSPQMTKLYRHVFHKFHDGMRVYARSDDGVCSAWLEVAQVLRGECLLSPLLLNVFSAAIVLVALLTTR